ncbi:hypothetical protein ACFSJW_01610 [Flavobacterium artemisiae]|uniref:Uncharacterized protein n=1 Tax=Flavobacterium artemisiae TaxID=2126556 RepID=A0ABW4HKS8_9FLAO
MKTSHLNFHKKEIHFNLQLSNCLLYLFFITSSLLSFSARAQRIGIPIEQTNSNFTISAVRTGLSSGYESYLFYVQNNTSREYKIVVHIDLELACEGAKSFNLGVNNVVHLRANERFTPSKDYVHNYFGNKDCAIAEGKSYTLFKSLHYTITSVVDVTKENEEKAAKKNAEQEQKKIEEQRKNAEQIRKQQEYQQSSAKQQIQQNTVTQQVQYQTGREYQPAQKSPAEQQAQYQQKLAVERAYNAQREETINKGISDMTNLISDYVQQNRADKERQEALQEQREAEQQERQYQLYLKTSSRINAFAALPAKDIPLASQEKAASIYYFIYSYNDLGSEYGAAAYISNVFEIGKYNDGTRAYTATIKNETAGLTPYAETLHGYYYTLKQAEQKRSELINSLQIYGVTINNLLYKGKPGTATVSQTAENQEPNYGNIIEKPAKIDMRPTNGTAPKNEVDKFIQKQSKKNYGTIIE